MVRTKNIVVTAILLAVTLLCAGGANADTFYYGFETGDLPFNAAGGFTEGNGTGQYRIGPNAKEFNSLWPGTDTFNPHEGAYMMCVNGGTGTVWSVNVSVAAGVTYRFSSWVASLQDAKENRSLATLGFKVGEVKLDKLGTETPGETFKAPDFFTNTKNASAWSPQWVQFSRDWVASENGVVILSIYETDNVDTNGNDFALDAITFEALTNPPNPPNPPDPPVPVPAALWLFGSGILGIAAIRGKFKR